MNECGDSGKSGGKAAVTVGGNVVVYDDGMAVYVSGARSGESECVSDVSGCGVCKE